MWRRRFIIVLLSIAALAGPVMADGPRRYAVVIGINDYADSKIPDLKYAESDAKSLYATLTNPKIGKFPKNNVTLLLGKAATPSAIKAAFWKLRGIGKDDLVIIFYSGHGAKEGDEAFWVTQNADHKALPATSLTNSEIRKYLRKIPTERMVILLDCCYAASTVKKSLDDPSRLFGDFHGKGRVTIAGSAANQEALEYEDKKAGVFTHFLVGGLRGLADSNTDGVVTFEELWGYLGENVRKASVKQGGLHEPVIITESGLTPKFLLTFNPVVQAESKEAVAKLREMFEEGKITGAQYDDGCNALTSPALDAAAKTKRDVFSDLVAGRLSPKYLSLVLARRMKTVKHPTRTHRAGKKPTLAVVPFDVLGNVRAKDAGKIIAEQLLPNFFGQYQLIDHGQLKRFLDQDDLTTSGLLDIASKPGTKSLSKAVKLRAVRYLVVGTLSSSPDGSLSITARISDWQSGKILSVGQVRARNWRKLLKTLPVLASRLTGREVVRVSRSAAKKKAREKERKDIEEQKYRELMEEAKRIAGELEKDVERLSK